MLCFGDGKWALPEGEENWHSVAGKTNSNSSLNFKPWTDPSTTVQACLSVEEGKTKKSTTTNFTNKKVTTKPVHKQKHRALEQWIASKV